MNTEFSSIFYEFKDEVSAYYAMRAKSKGNNKTQNEYRDKGGLGGYPARDIRDAKVRIDPAKDAKNYIEKKNNDKDKRREEIKSQVKKECGLMDFDLI